MADSAAPDSATDTASSAAATATTVAGSSSAPPVVTPVPKRSWGDEEDDDVVDAGDSAPSDYIESLKIEEENTLEEPEDSNITAVSLSLSLSSALASLG